MFNLLSSELFRMRKRTQSWLLLVISIVLFSLIYGGFVVAALVSSGSDAQELKEQATFSNFADFGVAMSVGFFASIMLIIVSAGMMGNEFSWNTLRPLVARARSRASLLTAKIAAVGIYAVLFVIALIAFVAVAFMVGSMIVGEPSGFSMSVLWDGIVFAFKALYANIPYMALAFLLATAFKSNAAGIAGALGVTFIEEPVFLLLGLASDFFENIREWGISYNVSVISNFGDSDNTTRSALILAGYSAIFIAVSYIIFLRRDVTSG